MKKRTLFVTIAAVVLSLGIALVVYASNQLSAQENSEPDANTEEVFDKQSTQEKVDVTPMEETHNRASSSEIMKASAKNESLLHIPVYSEDALLFDTNGMFFLGRDAAFYYGRNARQNSTEGIMQRYPTDAIRIKDNGDMYSIHETDSGYRLFLFYDQSLDYATTIGFPVVVKDMLSYADFSGLKPGDSIEAVEAVDSVAGLHKKLYNEVWELNAKGAQGHADRGYPCTSIHYLSDGLLKIEYDMPEDGVLVISRIEFAPDYILTDPIGRKVDYKIEEIDLPEQ